MRKVWIVLIMAMIIVPVVIAQKAESSVDVHLEVSREVVDGVGYNYFSFEGDDQYAKVLAPFSFKLTDAELNTLREHVGKLVKDKSASMEIAEDFVRFKTNGWGIKLTTTESAPEDRVWLSGYDAKEKILEFDEQLKNN